ncbi:C69 family dipeptidase [Limosilactobacillus mucosae]|nr:C69 family dipeptidase [Limosilactobacillus mucosae]
MEHFGSSHSSCTAMLVGKNATIDGSTIIARDEDGESAINQKTFKVFPARDYDEEFVSEYSGVKIPLHGHGFRFTATPNAKDNEIKGRWDEQGINEYNVAMSSTETEGTNARCLGHDPLVKNGIDEDSMLYLVLPFVKTAREGVARLGKLIEQYGTGECNGIAFADQDEVWYFETGAGHQWAAQRIPDDCYAICPNIMVIQEIDFNDPDNFMFAPTLKSFVEKNHLNPDPATFNYRNIFGTQSEADSYYNTPRTWYGQKLFNPSIEQDPTSQNMPFLRRPEKKIAIEDVEAFLSSHYNGTPYDPMGTFASGTKEDQRKFRSISLDRNQSSCILQIRNHVPKEFAAIQWINFGFYCYSPYVPFYTNISDTPANYQKAGAEVDPNSAYWMYKTLAVIIEPRYHKFINEVNEYRDGCQSFGLRRIDQIDQQAADLEEGELNNFLTKANLQTAAEVTKRTHALLSSLIKQSLLDSKYQFELGDNL